MITDKQMTGMAGEFFTVGKLFKMGLQVAITIGNAKAIDIIAKNPKNGKTYTVQVKTSKRKNNFRSLKTENIKDNTFVFIFLNEFKENKNNEEYFIVKGSEMLKNPQKFFGANYNSKNPRKEVTVYKKYLPKYKDNWKEFET